MAEENESLGVSVIGDPTAGEEPRPARIQREPLRMIQNRNIQIKGLGLKGEIE